MDQFTFSSKFLLTTTNTAEKIKLSSHFVVLFLISIRQQSLRGPHAGRCWESDMSARWDNIELELFSHGAGKSRQSVCWQRKLCGCPF